MTSRGETPRTVTGQCVCSLARYITFVVPSAGTATLPLLTDTGDTLSSRHGAWPKHERARTTAERELRATAKWAGSPPHATAHTAHMLMHTARLGSSCPNALGSEPATTTGDARHPRSPPPALPPPAASEWYDILPWGPLSSHASARPAVTSYVKSRPPREQGRYSLRLVNNRVTVTSEHKAYRSAGPTQHTARGAPRVSSGRAFTRLLRHPR